MKSENPPDNHELIKPIKSESRPDHAQDPHSQEMTSSVITAPPSYEWVSNTKTQRGANIDFASSSIGSYFKNKVCVHACLCVKTGHSLSFWGLHVFKLRSIYSGVHVELTLYICL